MSAWRGGCLPGGGLCLGGVSAWRGGLFWGGVPPNFFFEGGSPPEYGQRSAGTQPTGMHSCFPLFLLVSFTPVCALFTSASFFLHTTHGPILSSYILCQYLDQPTHYPKHPDKFLAILFAIYTVGFIFARQSRKVVSIQCFAQTFFLIISQK